MTDTATEELQRTLLNHIPHYAVLLHNDEVHSMDFVVESLLKSVPGLTQPEAIAIMLETHQTGRGHRLPVGAGGTLPRPYPVFHAGLHHRTGLAVPDEDTVDVLCRPEHPLEAILDSAI